MLGGRPFKVGGSGGGTKRRHWFLFFGPKTKKNARLGFWILAKNQNQKAKLMFGFWLLASGQDGYEGRRGELRKWIAGGSC